MWLNVSFQPVQLQTLKSKAQRQLDCLGHVSAVRIRRADVVAHVGTVKVSLNDLTQID